MEPEEYKGFKQSKIQLYSRIKLRNIFPGEWESIYTGEGIEFADIKPFEPGDDLRDLDLITLVQSGEEEIIRRSVGRRMRMFLWVDMSGSMRRFREMFFSFKPEIRDIAVGLLAYSAFNVYVPVGLCIFDEEIRFFITAKYGEGYCDEIMKRVTDRDYQDTPAPADIHKAISFLMQRAYNQSMVFFISDFKDPVFQGDFSSLLRPVAKKFDFIPVVIRDPIEKDVSLKRPINIAVNDNEGSKGSEIYLTPEKLKEIQHISAAHLANLKRNFRRAGIEHIVLDSPSIEDCYQALSGFFESRKRVVV